MFPVRARRANGSAEVPDLPSKRNTVMDLSLANALYFASRGNGLVWSAGGGIYIPYASAARVLLSGLGSDELLGGYGRHRTTFKCGSWPALIDEVRQRGPGGHEFSSLIAGCSFRRRSPVSRRATSGGTTASSPRMARNAATRSSPSTSLTSLRGSRSTRRRIRGPRPVSAISCYSAWRRAGSAWSKRAVGIRRRCSLGATPRVCWAGLAIRKGISSLHSCIYRALHVLYHISSSYEGASLRSQVDGVRARNMLPKRA
jgi:hypothetical protein